MEFVVDGIEGGGNAEGGDDDTMNGADAATATTRVLLSQQMDWVPLVAHSSTTPSAFVGAP